MPGAIAHLAGLDDQALPEVLPARLDGRPLERKNQQALGGVKPVDVDVDHVAGGRELALELFDRDDALALGAEVDEDDLASDRDDLAISGD